MAGATSSTRFDGVAVPGMASWGDPLGTTVSGVLIGDRGVERLDVGVALSDCAGVPAAWSVPEALFIILLVSLPALGASASCMEFTLSCGGCIPRT